MAMPPGRRGRCVERRSPASAMTFRKRPSVVVAHWTWSSSQTSVRDEEFNLFFWYSFAKILHLFSALPGEVVLRSAYEHVEHVHPLEARAPCTGNEDADCKMY